MQAELCKSASSGKPYLPQPVPLVALVREQRFAPAHAGDAFLMSLRLQISSGSLGRPRPFPGAAFAPASEPEQPAPSNGTNPILTARSQTIAREACGPSGGRSPAAERPGVRGSSPGTRSSGCTFDRVGVSPCMPPLPDELDATPLIDLARAHGCSVYLPRIDRHTLGSQDAVRADDRADIAPTDWESLSPKARDPSVRGGSMSYSCRSWVSMRVVCGSERRRLLRSRVRFPPLAQGLAYAATR